MWVENSYGGRDGQGVEMGKGSSTEAQSKNPEYIDKYGQQATDKLWNYYFSNPTGQTATSTGATPSNPLSGATNAASSMGGYSFQNGQPATRPGISTGTGSTATPAMPGGDINYMRPLVQYGDPGSGSKYGSTVAPLSQLQQQAAEVAQRQPGSFAGYFNDAKSDLSQGTQRYGQTYDPNAVSAGDVSTDTWGKSQQDQYMSPYITGSLDVTANKMQRDLAQQQAANRQREAAMGAFGGSRGAVLEAKTQSDANRDIGDMYSTGLSNAYNQAFQNYATDASRGLQAQTANQNKDVTLGQFNEGQREHAFNDNRDQLNQENNRFLQAADSNRNLASTQSDIASANMNRLLTTGALQQQVGQQQRAEDATKFDQRNNYVPNTLNAFLASLKGNPSSGSITSVPQPSAAGQLAGILPLLLAGVTGGTSLAGMGATDASALNLGASAF